MQVSRNEMGYDCNNMYIIYTRLYSHFVGSEETYAYVNFAHSMIHRVESPWKIMRNKLTTKLPLTLEPSYKSSK